MAKDVKQVLEASELEQLQSIRTGNRDLRAELAEISILEIRIAARKEHAKTYMSQLEETDRALGNTLREKYGDISIDLETGEYTSAETADQPVEESTAE